MIRSADLHREAKETTTHPHIQMRQDKADCDVCDWHIGWDLNPDVVEKYFRQHQIETGHTIAYSVEQITKQTSAYLIEAS
jgi:hypothetical protein